MIRPEPWAGGNERQAVHAYACGPWAVAQWGWRRLDGSAIVWKRSLQWVLMLPTGKSSPYIPA